MLSDIVVLIINTQRSKVNLVTDAAKHESNITKNGGHISFFASVRIQGLGK